MKWKNVILFAVCAHKNIVCINQNVNNIYVIGNINLKNISITQQKYNYFINQD